MSKLVFGKNTSVNVQITGMTIHPTRERTLTLGLSNKNKSYKCLVNLTQFYLDSIAHCLKHRSANPTAKYLIFEMTPSLTSNEVEPDRVGFDSSDIELLEGIFKHAPSLLAESWLTHEDALRLVDFQLEWITKNTDKIQS